MFLENTELLYQQCLLQKLGENTLESKETLYEHIYDCIYSVAGEARGSKGGKKYTWSEETEATIRRKKNSYLIA